MPTAIQNIARFGEVANALRAAMEAANLTAYQLSVKIDPIHKGRVVPSINNWLAAKNAPGAVYRSKVAKALGIAPHLLEPRRLNEDHDDEPGPSGQLVVMPAAKPTGRRVFGFEVDSLGIARINLNVELPFERGVALMRLLMDAGLIMQTQEQAP